VVEWRDADHARVDILYRYVVRVAEVYGSVNVGSVTARSSAMVVVSVQDQ
jgi:hypothetical protein